MSFFSVHSVCNRLFILVEMEPKIAREVTAERVRRVDDGYVNAKDGSIEGIGGNSRFCELGERMFDENGRFARWFASPTSRGMSISPRRANRGA